jgi:guanylate kinase
VIFDRPTLITLTAPTCSGKTHLLNALAELGCKRVVSTTTRNPRPGEECGIDYHFISRLESETLEAEGAFAELVTYNGVRYGVTNSEMRNKMVPGKPAPVVILTPHGIDIYQRYCAEQGWGMFKVFVYAQTQLCLERLAQRTATEIALLTERVRVPTETLSRVMLTHNSRVKAVLQDEATWQSKASWDLLVPGDNLQKALADLELGVALRNRREREACLA